MILTLKNDVLYYPKNYILPEGPVRLEFDLPEKLKGKEIKVKINSRHKKVYKDPFYIPEEELKKQEFQVKLYIGNREYKSEKINITKMIALGESLSTGKSSDIIDLEHKVSILHRDVQNLKEAIIEMAKKGEII